MRKSIWISLIAVTILGVSILFAFFAYNSLSSSQGTNAPSDVSASPIMAIGQFYLSKPSYFPENSSDKLTKIYLKNATLWYDYTNASFTSDSGYENYEGVRAVVINVTIRNDYSEEEIVAFSQEGLSEFKFAIDVYLYDEEGTIVPTVHRGNPFRGCQEFSLKSGVTFTSYLVFATDNRNIDSFGIYFSWPLGI